MGDITPERQHILVALPYSQEMTEIFDKIKAKHPNVDFTCQRATFTPDKTTVAKIPDDYWKEFTIIVTFSTLPSDPKLAPNLNWIHFMSAGTNHIANTPIYKDSLIPLTTSSGIHGPQIAEWVIMQILSNSHNEKVMLQYQREHKWASKAEIGSIRDSVGQRLGVLGYGSIGRQTARVAKALGMDIIAYTASPRKTSESKKDTGYIVPHTGDPDGTLPSAWFSGLDKASLHHFLSQDIDVLLIAVPLTPKTLHFLGAAEFGILGRKNALIVNIARGSIVVQDELIVALNKTPEEGGLRGAALDVTDPEPLGEESELWEMRNVAVTPHVSGQGTAYVERSFAILERNLTNWEEERRLINVVDRARGY
ncbi:D-isomer-specific 2-hydroxyacid dehydrogenase-like protein [Calycina marina]|uniref:D-isomer-specific 2-hydroxyacid dehydrogenase-like protein n=1 Tax=Calycina marina TaxID=1763456 RepID=A0A9P7ZAD4_9HELO|nr:D-isomer-specific 2-hydroxyacid dehydrogenase-like protein [Calycina marina]